MSILSLATSFAVLTMAVVVVAVLVVSPVLVVTPVPEGSVTAGRLVDQGGPNAIHSTAREANRGDSRIGRRTRRTPSDLAPIHETTVASGWQG